MAQHDEHVAQQILRRQAKWQEADAKELDNAITAMLQHKETRRYLYWLLEMTRAIGQNPMTDNALRTAFNCGEQNVGQQIMAHLIDVAPEGFLTLLKEKSDERRERSNTIAGIRAGTDRANDTEPDRGDAGG
jgi:CRP-like cAMP-binding protein